MNNIKIYENFDDEKENLEFLIDFYKPYITEFFKDRMMECDYLIINPEQFVIEYWSMLFDGRIPKRISYYMDELVENLKKIIGIKFDWNFSPNGNSQRLEFTLEEEISDEILKKLKKTTKVKNILKMI